MYLKIRETKLNGDVYYLSLILSEAPESEPKNIGTLRVTEEEKKYIHTILNYDEWHRVGEVKDARS